MITVAETLSTNTLALDSIRTMGGPDGREADGLVVMADYQTAGRGRFGRRWLSPRGASILCSVVIVPADQELTAANTGPSPGGHVELQALENSGRPTPTAQFSGHLTLVSAIAACEAIRQSTEITPTIKWPNDLRVSGRKLGGILIESRPVAQMHRAWVIGIGINCLQHAGHFPPELRTFATSLEIEASHPIERIEVAKALLQHLDHRLADVTLRASPPASFQAIRSAWEQYAEPVGQRVRLRARGREWSGTTIAVDPFGGLILQTDDGKQEWFDPLQTTLL
ncbi:MAG TPA: biotin--[acetyl-CoA-carboxylase] ligase [Phycisphaerae bacterium]|nr:biotin--[acetyl-CoA-carboxylase] ligase [Phycisphaerae bacterium]HRR86127.1 biotin--[acetyl-CoA-carboxylase] ligase [Phycisphaerae bacterium]